jgi:Ca2+-binding EF-hand superfamily protein
MCALVLFPAVAAAQQPCTSDARHIVNEIYSHVLERSADRGSDQMVRRLSSGQATVQDIVRDVVASTEHAQRFLATGSRDANERAVTALYRHVLGRDPDPNGLRANTDGLEANGMEAVIDSLLNSPEYEQKYGDFGVPGTPGLRFCAVPSSSRGNNRGNSNINNNETRRLRGMDRNNDGVVARSEWQGDRQSFAQYDINRDGVLSGDELRGDEPVGNDRVPPRLGGTIERQGGTVERIDATAAGFTSLDRNRDNRITESEWLYDYQAFDRADRNGDGVLSRAEFLASDSSAGDTFSSQDTNNDGRLTIGEWQGTRRQFTDRDANGDGVISRREFSER